MTVAKGLMLQPVLGIVFAFLLLGEVANTTQWIAGGIIFIGMLVSYEHPKESPPAASCLEQRLKAV